MIEYFREIIGLCPWIDVFSPLPFSGFLSEIPPVAFKTNVNAMRVPGAVEALMMAGKLRNQVVPLTGGPSFGPPSD